EGWVRPGCASHGQHRGVTLPGARGGDADLQEHAQWAAAEGIESLSACPASEITWIACRAACAGNTDFRRPLVPSVQIPADGMHVFMEWMRGLRVHVCPGHLCPGH